MGEKISAYTISKLNEIQSEATKTVMKMAFFLNYGGIVAILAAFSSSVFLKHSSSLLLCLSVFLFGLVCSVLMALELRKFAYDAYSKAKGPFTTDDAEDELNNFIQNHRGKCTIYGFCISSLVFFGLGIIVGFVTLIISF
jgi:magnesium-transporting ATPase (P-type)